MAQKFYKATLTAGETYVLAGAKRQTFLYGKPVPVEQDTKDYLAESAVERVTVSRGGGAVSGVQEVPKFSFEEIDEATYRELTGAAPKATRTRSRS